MENRALEKKTLAFSKNCRTANCSQHSTKWVQCFLRIYTNGLMWHASSRAQRQHQKADVGVTIRCMSHSQAFQCTEPRLLPCSHGPCRAVPALPEAARGGPNFSQRLPGCDPMLLWGWGGGCHASVSPVQSPPCDTECPAACAVLPLLPPHTLYSPAPLCRNKIKTLLASVSGLEGNRRRDGGGGWRATGRSLKAILPAKHKKSNCGHSWEPLLLSEAA